MSCETWWGGWNARLGGDASAGLALVLRPPSQSTVFAADGGGIIRFRHWNGSRWTSWSRAALEPLTLDGGGIDAVTPLPSRIDLVVRDSQGHTRHAFGNVTATENEWSSWRDYGRTMGPPTITRTARDRLQIFSLGPNGILLWRRWERDHWSNEGRWEWLKNRDGQYPGMRDGGPHPPLSAMQVAAVKLQRDDTERIDLIAGTMDRRVVHAYWNGRHWSGFADISGSLAGKVTKALALTSPGPTRLELLAQLEDGSVHWKRWDDRWVHDWTRLARGGTRPGLQARALSSERTDVVARGSETSVLYAYTRCDRLPEAGASAPDHPLSLFFLNMGLLVAPGEYKGWDRDGAIEHLIHFLRTERFDVACLAEIFADGERDQIARSLGDIYPPENRVEGPDEADLDSDGGLLLLSRHPILARHQLVFDDIANPHYRALPGFGGWNPLMPPTLARGADAWANKGILHARIRVPGHPTDYSIFLTHLQNPNEGGHEASLLITLEQASVVQRFVSEHTNADVALIVGDFNLDAFDPTVYADFRRRMNGAVELWNVCGAGEGPGMTSDNLRDFEPPKPSRALDSRHLETRSENGKRIDYILLWSPRRLSGYGASVELVTERFVPSGESDPRDLADHYGLRLEQTKLVID